MNCLHLPQTVDVANRAVVDDAIAGLRVDGAADVVADRRAVLLEPEVVGDVHVARLKHVHWPRVRPTDAPLLTALVFDDAQDVGPPRQPLRGQRAADEHLARVNRHPVVLELMREAGACDHRPGFLQRHALHAVEDGVRHVRTAVREAFPFPVRRVFDQLFLREHARLRLGERRDREQQGDGH